MLPDEDAQLLSSLRDLLGLEMSQVQAAHEEVCSEAYSKSVKEVMGAGGVVPDEYWDGLATLRERLGLSEETAQELFLTIARGKMKEFGQKAMEVMQTKMQEQQKQAEEPSGDDPLEGKEIGGMDDTSISTEVLNLVDFCQSSKILVTHGLLTSKLEATELRKLAQLLARACLEAHHHARCLH